MSHTDYTGKFVSIGIDVHKRQYTLSCVSEGVKLRQVTMPPSGEELVKFVSKHFPGAKIRSAYEAGFSGFGLHRYLTASGFENIVVNAASIEISAKDKVKTDRRDSLKIAVQLDTRQLKGIRIPTLEQEAARLLPRTRQQLVWCRTRNKNRLRMRLYQFGFELGKTLSMKQVGEFLDNHPQLPPELVVSVQSYLRLWECCERELKVLAGKLSLQAASDELESVYRSLPGVGQESARIFSTELGDMSQFNNERQLSSFLGLTPTERSSGDNQRKGHITHQGNPQLRCAIIEAAWSAVTHDEYWKHSFNRLKVTKGSSKAIVAIARRLIGTARALIRKKETYTQPPIKLAA